MNLHLECRNCGPCLAKLDRSPVGGAELEVARRLPRASLAAGRKKVLFFLGYPCRCLLFSATFVGLTFFPGRDSEPFRFTVHPRTLKNVDSLYLLTKSYSPHIAN